jgi:uncharacterized membrane protein
MKTYSKEIPLWVLILLPYAYLATVWKKLPDRVPTHFSMEGIPNDWSDKSTLLILPGLVGLGIYLLMLFIPSLDPKKKIQEMGGKYYTFRLMLGLFISLILTYGLCLSSGGAFKNPYMMFALIGAFFAMLGNYFQTIRPNYFIGIRTPWTLENENVWKKTHRLGGQIWMAGGAIIVILSLMIYNNQSFMFFFLAIIACMVLIPIVYSYMLFQKERNSITQ